MFCSDSVNAEALTSLTAFANILADGQAPKQLRPYLGGAKGTAGAKKSKTGQPDARPLCAGEFFRRVVSRCILYTEADTLREHLLPHQLAVAVKAGVEVLPHVSRQWRDDHAADVDRILLTFDEANAHNECDRHCFLTRMGETCPGASRWLEYIYPTDQPTKVFYRGHIIDSSSGGQQGDPLMMACHAMVQRMLWEGLGLVAIPEGTVVQLPVLSPPAQLDFAASFADDGVLAGSSQEILRSLRHLQSIMPTVKLRFSTLAVAPSAGKNHRIDLRPFVELGCTISEDSNLEILKSLVGDIAWSLKYCETYVNKHVEIAK